MQAFAPQQQEQPRGGAAAPHYGMPYQQQPPQGPFVNHQHMGNGMVGGGHGMAQQQQQHQQYHSMAPPHHAAQYVALNYAQLPAAQGTLVNVGPTQHHPVPGAQPQTAGVPPQYGQQQQQQQQQQRNPFASQPHGSGASAPAGGGRGGRTGGPPSSPAAAGSAGPSGAPSGGGSKFSNNATDDPSQMNYQNLFITKIPRDVTDGSLLTIFKPFGAISAKVMVDAASGYSKGFGFVVFPSEQQGKWVHEAYNKRPIAVAEEALLAALPADRPHRQTYEFTMFPSHHDSGSAAKECTSLYIRNVPRTWDVPKVVELLRLYGDPIYYAVRDDRLGNPVWVVYVEYDCLTCSRNALKHIHGLRTGMGQPPILAKYADNAEVRKFRRDKRMGQTSQQAAGTAGAGASGTDSGPPPMSHEGALSLDGRVSRHHQPHQGPHPLTALGLSGSEGSPTAVGGPAADKAGVVPHPQPQHPHPVGGGGAGAGGHREHPVPLSHFYDAHIAFDAVGNPLPHIIKEAATVRVEALGGAPPNTAVAAAATAAATPNAALPVGVASPMHQQPSPVSPYGLQQQPSPLGGSVYSHPQQQQQQQQHMYAYHPQQHQQMIVVNGAPQHSNACSAGGTTLATISSYGAGAAGGSGHNSGASSTISGHGPHSGVMMGMGVGIGAPMQHPNMTPYGMPQQQQQQQPLFPAHLASAAAALALSAGAGGNPLMQQHLQAHPMGSGSNSNNNSNPAHPSNFRGGGSSAGGGGGGNSAQLSSSGVASSTNVNASSGAYVAGPVRHHMTAGLEGGASGLGMMGIQQQQQHQHQQQLLLQMQLLQQQQLQQQQQQQGAALGLGGSFSGAMYPPQFGNGAGDSAAGGASAPGSTIASPDAAGALHGGINNNSLAPSAATTAGAVHGGTSGASSSVAGATIPPLAGGALALGLGIPSAAASSDGSSAVGSSHSHHIDMAQW